MEPADCALRAFSHVLPVGLIVEGGHPVMFVPSPTDRVRVIHHTPLPVDIATFAQLTPSVVTVGAGRGFIMDAGRYGRIIVTAGHCFLEALPISSPHAAAAARLFPEVIGLLNDPAGRRVWGALLYADPVSDVAVLGVPDDVPNEAAAYDELSMECTPFQLTTSEFLPSQVVLRPGPGPLDPGPDPLEETENIYDAFVLTLDGEWVAGRATFGWAGFIQLTDFSKGGITSGMSGSPIVDSSGAVIGLIANGLTDPQLSERLPTWLLRLFRGEKRWVKQHGDTEDPNKSYDTSTDE